MGAEGVVWPFPLGQGGLKLRRRTLKTALVSLAFMFLFGLFAPTADAACGGCFCSVNGPSQEGGYSCVQLKGYNRWLKDATA